MCRPPALAGHCGGVPRCAGRMAIGPHTLPLASAGARAVAACGHCWRGRGWRVLRFHFEMGVDAAEGELMIALLAGLLEGVVGKVAIVAMVVADGNAMLGSKLLERSLGLD